MIILDIFDV